MLNFLNSFLSQRKTFRFIGFSLLVISILWNTIFVALIIGVSRLNIDTQAGVWSFQLQMFLLGIIILFCRRSFERFLIGVIFVFLFFESLSYLILNHKPINVNYESWSDPEKSKSFHPILGFAPEPHSKGSIVKKVNEKIIYVSNWSIDQYGRRITPMDSKQRDKYILFFGDSFTYGWEVSDNQTIPYYFSLLAPASQSYNYAMGGYGPEHMLARFENFDLSKEVTQKNGCAIYIFLDFQMGRARGARSYLLSTLKRPFYHLENGKAVTTGFLQNERPLLLTFYKIIDFSLTNLVLKIMRKDLPLWFSDQDYETLGAIFRGAADRYSQQFRNDNFYVLLYPTYSYNYEKVKNVLIKNHVKVLDYQYLFDLNKEGSRYELGGHAKPIINFTVARKLASDLGDLDFNYSRLNKFFNFNIEDPWLPPAGRKTNISSEKQ